jgi:hypothetical protein
LTPRRFRNRDGRVGQGGTAHPAQIERHNPVIGHTETGGHAPRGFEFDPVTLAVIEGQGMTDMSSVTGDGQDSGGIQPAGQQHHGIRHR